MTMTSPTTVLGVEESDQARAQGSWRIAWQKLTSTRLNLICLTILAVYIALGLLAFTPYFTAKVTEKVGASYTPPSFGTPALWLGTDIQGYSVFWRVLYGTRVALTIAGVATFMETLLGLFFGVLSGYFGGWI